jgi:tetratricopeptide (TPR) repeat protein
MIFVSFFVYFNNNICTFTVLNYHKLIMLTATTYYQQGQINLQKGKLAEAYNACKKALMLDPQMTQAQQRIYIINYIMTFSNRQAYNC